jgi:hypothetical protein
VRIPAFVESVEEERLKMGMEGLLVANQGSEGRVGSAVNVISSG